MEEEKKCEDCGEDCSGDCEHCSQKPRQGFKVEMNDQSNIRLIVGVLSGKGASPWSHRFWQKNFGKRA